MQRIWVILHLEVEHFCFMRHWATFIGINGAPPPTLYPVLFIHPCFAVARHLQQRWQTSCGRLWWSLLFISVIHPLSIPALSLAEEREIELIPACIGRKTGYKFKFNLCRTRGSFICNRVKTNILVKNTSLFGWRWSCASRDVQ